MGQQKTKLDEARTKLIFCGPKAINEKIEQVMNWINEPMIKQKKKKQRPKNEKDKSLLDLPTPVSRGVDRCIVFTVCYSNNLLSSDQEIIETLNQAIINGIKMLRPDDYVCFNFGNSSQLMLCDEQINLNNWNIIMNQFKGLEKMTKLRKSEDFFVKVLDNAALN